MRKDLKALTEAAVARRLRWAVPLGLMALVVAYEVGPSQWVRLQLGPGAHMLAEVLVYGTIGPAIAYVLLDFLARWLEERETSELQSRLLARAREQSRACQELGDTALQELYAASLRLQTLEADLRGQPAEAGRVGEARQSLDAAIRKVRQGLLQAERG
jgi:signal transduction histidine kinase